MNIRRTDRKILGLAIVAVVVVVGIGTFQKSRLPVDSYDTNHARVALGNQKLQVEVVSTPADIQRGLSGRDHIGSDGLLFVFNPAQEVVFWMKDMQFDLDLIWIKAGKVVGVTTHVPRPLPNQSLDQLPRYPSPDKVDHVLEATAGASEIWGLRVGDQVIISPELRYDTSSD